MKAIAQSGVRSAWESGFSLAELIVVVAIILIVGGLSLPSLSRTIDNSRLQGATQVLASSYQDARIRATQNNTVYQLLVSAPGVVPAQVCIDLDGDGICGPGDPVTIFPGQVTVTNAGVPFPLGAAQLNFPVSDAESTSMPTLTWNGRGLPCQRSSANAPCTAVTGWVQHLQYQGSGGSVLYGAVSVSPIGRVKTWVYIPSANGNGQWF